MSLEGPGDEVAAVRAPWSSIATGWYEREYWLDVAVGKEHYTSSLTGGVDGALSETFELRDVLPGNGPELVILLAEIRDGGKDMRLFVCGVGPSMIPSCADVGLGITDLNDHETYEVTTLRGGGVNVLTTENKRQKLWFEFP